MCVGVCVFVVGVVFVCVFVLVEIIDFFMLMCVKMYGVDDVRNVML